MRLLAMGDANILTDGHVHDAISTGVVHALVQAHAACKSDAAVRECGVALCEAAISTKGSDDRLGLFNCGVLKVIQAYIFQEDSSSMHEQACRALTKMSV